MTERKAELEWLRAEARVQTQRSHRHEAPAASTPSLMSARQRRAESLAVYTRGMLEAPLHTAGAQ